MNYIIDNQNTITLWHDNQTFSVDVTHRHYHEILNKVANDDPTDLMELISVKSKIENFFKDFGDDVILKDDTIFYRDYPIENVLTERIIKMAYEGLEPIGLIRFLKNLLENPSRRSIDSLFGFLQHNHLPITSMGCFMGYKAVQEDYMSKTEDKKTGKQYDNHVGKVVEMPRWEVDKNPNNSCSYGLHIGTLKYAKNFARCDDRIVIVNCNPKNVVTVPDREDEKLRCCHYWVVADYVEPLDDLYVQEDNS